MYYKLNELINKHDDIRIFHHVTPDGDCLGSQYGLYYLIKDNYPNKKVTLISSEKLRFDFFSYNPQQIEDDNLQFDGLAIVVDTSSIKRVSGNSWRSAGDLIVIDHHDTVKDSIANEYSKATMYVEPKFPSNASFIGHIAKSLNWKISDKAKYRLLTGMITDTRDGNISYVVQNNAGSIFNEFSKGIDVEKLRAEIVAKDKNYINVLRWFYKNINVNGKFNYMIVDKKDLQELNETWETFYRLVNEMGLIGTPEYWFSFTWVDEDKYKFSIRSYASTVRVDTLAEKLGGGGHKWSAGAFCNKQQMEDFIKERIK